MGISKFTEGWKKATLVGLLLFCLSALSSAGPAKKAPSQDIVFGPEYDFKGECFPSITKENYYCLPHKDISFNDMFNAKYLEVYLRDIEYWFMNNPYQKVQLDIKRLEDGRFGVFSKEIIKMNQIIYQENFYDRFNHTCLGESFWEPKARIIEVLSKLPTINFTDSGIVRFIFTFLVHLYNLPVSKTKTILRLLPSIPDSPLFTLTPYELELLKLDVVHEKFLEMHRRVKIEYDYMIKTLKATWSEEEIESVFKFSDIPFDDFIYAYYVTMSKTTHRGNKFKDDVGVIYLPLGTLYYRGKPGKRTNLLIRFNREADDFAVQAIDDIKKGEELFLPVTAYDDSQLMELGQGKEEENCHFFLKMGYVPEVNKRECITLFLMEPHMAELWGLPSDACVNGLSNRLMAYHAVGNLINMNEEEYRECEQLIFHDPRYNLTYAGPEEEKIRIFEVCKHVPWKKFNIFDKSLNQLEDMIEKYQKRLTKVEKYIKFRESKGLSSKNGHLIYDYLEARHDLAKQIKLNIENMMLNPKKYKQDRDEL